MSDDIHVRARLTADNDASPKIKKLASDLQALENQLKKNIAKSPLGGGLISDKLLQNLKKTSGELDSITPRYMKWARGVKAANQMTANGYLDLTKKLKAYDDLFTKQNGKITKASQKEIKDLYRKAQAYRAVFNEMYQDRDRLERKSSSLRNRIDEENNRQARNRAQQTHQARMRQTALTFRLMRQHERENEVEHRASLRRQANDRSSLGRSVRGVGSNINNARNRLDGQFFNSPTFYAMAAGGAAGAGIASSFRTRMKTNTAETNLGMFGGLSPDAIRSLRKDWGDKTAIKYGFSPADFLDVATEVLKAGIPEAAMRAVSETAMQAASGLDLNVAETMKLAGRAATLTQDMKNFDPNAIKEIMNGIAVAAKETAADASEIVAANRRGSGVMASSKMSMSQLSAFTASGISGAMQSGRAGTFMGFLVNEIVNAKGAGGQRGRDLQKAFGILGMGGKASAARMMADNPTQTIMSMLDRMGGMDEVRRGEVADLIGMREWRDELLIMVKVRDDIARTLSAIDKQPGFLDEASGKKVSSLAGRWKSFVGSMNLIWENVGAGFENTFIQLTDTFTQIGDRFDVDFFKRHVEFAVNGFVRGFGYDTFSEMFRSIFGGASGALNIRGLDSTFRFFKGFAEGLKSVGTFVVGILKAAGAALGIDTSTAEGLGEVTAKLIGFSLALHFARPAFSLLGAVGDAIKIVAGIIISAYGAMKVAGLFAGGLAAAGAGAGVMTAGTLIMRLAGVSLIGGALAVAIMNWDDIRKGKEAVTGFWDHFWNGPSDPAQAKAIEDAKKQQKGPFEVLGKALREMFGISSAKAGELPPGYQNSNPGRRLEQSAEKISATMDGIGARFQLAGLTGGGGGGFSSFSGGGGGSVSIGGGSIGNGRVNAFGLSRKGIIGGGFSSGTPGAGLFDAIINAEGTARGGRDPYSTVLGYGKYGSPSKNLTDMTLNEVKEFGLSMRRRQAEQGTAWNKTSSASGAFQIVGSTMMDAARALGMDPNSTKFTPDTQRQMAAWIAKRQGLGAWEGFKHHPGERAKAAAAMSGGGASALTGISDGAIPVKTSDGRTVMMDPKSGFGQAFGGGNTNAGVLAAAQAITGSKIAGGLGRFTAFNDFYHAGTNSKHASGLAGDFTIKDPTKSAEAAEQLRGMFRAAGLAENMFKVIDEYKNPSGRATGGHLHYQFNNPEAASQFAAHQRAKALAAQTPQGLASSIPFTPPSAKPGGMFDPNGGAGVPGFNAPITIQGGNQSPEEIANAVQRRIQEAMNWRTHDVESELT